MISVCIATFNGERFIEVQLRSILQQLKSDDEIIISDDGSTDKTIEIASNMQDSRIKILQHNKEIKKHSYLMVTRNLENALYHAKGDYIFLADQDDEWLPGKVEKCIQNLESSDLVLHDCIVVDEVLQVLAPSYFHLNKSNPGMISNLVSNAYLGCCMAFKRAVLQQSLPIPAVPHDIWIGLIAEYYGKVKFIDSKLLHYRRHGNNLSPSAEKSPNTLTRKLWYRTQILYFFCKRIILP